MHAYICIMIILKMINEHILCIICACNNALMKQICCHSEDILLLHARPTQPLGQPKKNKQVINCEECQGHKFHKKVMMVDNIRRIK